jgi:hypothetical protein
MTQLERVDIPVCIAPTAICIEQYRYGVWTPQAHGLDEECLDHMSQSGRRVVHDLRHTFISALAEAGVPESTMKAIAGWMSAKMLERYSHVRAQAKREAVNKLPQRRPPLGFPQNPSTFSTSNEQIIP